MSSAQVLGEMNLQWPLQCVRATVLTLQHLMALVEAGQMAEEEAGAMPEEEEEAGAMPEEEEEADEVVVLVLDVVEEEWEVEETEFNQRPC